MFEVGLGNFANLTKGPSLLSLKDIDMVPYHEGVEPAQKHKDHTMGCVVPTQVINL